MAFPNWLSMHSKQSIDYISNKQLSIFSTLTVLSFYPQIRRLWLRKDSSGISIYYVLFNLIATTEQFTIMFFLLVNNNLGGGLFVHSPPITGDWLNLGQMTVSYVFSFVLFAFTLHYLPDGGLTRKYTTVVIMIAFLVISVILELYDVATGGTHDNGPYREWALALFGVPHIIFINPVVTLLIVISFIFQVGRALHEPSLCMSIRGLAFQYLVFALPGVSWLLRVQWLPSTMPSYYKSLIVEVFIYAAWAAVDHFLFALRQVLLCFIIWRRSINAAQGPAGETEPFLGGRQS